MQAVHKTLATILRVCCFQLYILLLYCIIQVFIVGFRFLI